MIQSVCHHTILTYWLNLRKVQEKTCIMISKWRGVLLRVLSTVKEVNMCVRSAGSILMLETVSGPSRGLRYSTQSTNISGLPLTLGRVPPSALLLKDSEVSGKHAMIKWNLNVIFLKLCYLILYI